MAVDSKEIGAYVSAHVQGAVGSKKRSMTMAAAFVQTVFKATLSGNTKVFPLLVMLLQRHLSEDESIEDGELSKKEREFVSQFWAGEEAQMNPRRREAESPALGKGGVDLDHSAVFTLLVRHNFMPFAHMVITILLGAAAASRLLWHVEAMANVVKDIAAGTRRRAIFTDEPAHGAIAVVMQRLHEEDLVDHLLRQGGWHELSLPLVAEEA